MIPSSTTIAAYAICAVAAVIAFGAYLGWFARGMNGVAFRHDSNNVLRFTPLNVMRLIASPIRHPKMWWTVRSLRVLWDVNFWASWAPGAAVLGWVLGTCMTNPIGGN